MELDCIVCPMSCHLYVVMEQDTILKVEGNTCLRGERFARQEITCPMRMVTTTIQIHHALHPLLPVITSQSVPKDKIFAIMEICKTLEVEAPVLANEVLVENIADSKADLLASRTLR